MTVAFFIDCSFHIESVFTFQIPPQISFYTSLVLELIGAAGETGSTNSFSLKKLYDSVLSTVMLGIKSAHHADLYCSCLAILSEFFLRCPGGYVSGGAGGATSDADRLFDVEKILNLIAKRTSRDRLGEVVRFMMLHMQLNVEGTTKGLGEAGAILFDMFGEEVQEVVEEECKDGGGVCYGEIC